MADVNLRDTDEAKVRLTKIAVEEYRLGRMGARKAMSIIGMLMDGLGEITPEDIEWAKRIISERYKTGGC